MARGIERSPKRLRRYGVGIVGAAVAVSLLAGCDLYGPSNLNGQQEKAFRDTFTTASPVTLEVGGAFKTLPIRDLGMELPYLNADQYQTENIWGRKLDHRANIHDYGVPVPIYINSGGDAFDLEDDHARRILYPSDSRSWDLDAQGKPGPVQAIEIFVDGHGTRELQARVLDDGRVEVVDVEALKTPDKTDGFDGNPVILFMKDHV